MADTTTSNLLLTKPEVGASTDTWGSKINTDLDSIDAVFAAAGTGTSVGLNVGSGKTLKVAGTTDFSANLTFTGTGNRITGDFSNATFANRVAFQTSTVNGNTTVNAIPNGTATTSQFITHNAADPGNSSRAGVNVTSTVATFFSDLQGTGTYLPMTFYTGGSERMRVDTSGNVGIGTSSPSSRLDVRTSAAEIARFSSSATNGGYQIFYPDNVTTPVYVGSLKAILSTGNATDFAIVGTGANNMVFGTNSAERMRIDSSGNLLVGTTSGGGAGGVTFYPLGNGAGSATVQVFNKTNTTSDPAIQFRVNGSTVASISYTSTTVTYATSSDYRLKNTIAPMTGALAKVALLKPCTYKWNVDGSDGQGFIAHELAEVVPQCVTGEKDAVDAEGNPIHQGIDTSFLVATLTAAIQEQQAIITTLTDRITALEAK